MNSSSEGGSHSSVTGATDRRQAALRLPAAFARQIEREAVAAYPNECCGILFGRDSLEGRIVERIQAVPNAFDQTERFHRFSISPRQLIDAEKQAAAEGRVVLGFYHSHPNAPARPSEYDRTHAWPFYSYVIVSILNGQAADMTSWVLDERTETFTRQEIEQTQP
ncbi:M67 family metallopeptidase [Fontivita pretiosa]|uniref:M67 family metallopeptidase n=1 Tax=Fontivita pretiosa TaxID=2989684 RepID=UPI003D181289